MMYDAEGPDEVELLVGCEEVFEFLGVALNERRGESKHFESLSGNAEALPG